MDNLDKAVYESIEEALHRIADMLYVINETLTENYFRKERKTNNQEGDVEDGTDELTKK